MMNRSMAIGFAVVASALFAMVAGCSPYVNIPAQPGDVATHSPNGRPVRNVMAAALTHAITEAGPPERYAVALPQRASRATYERVIKRLPEGATRHGEHDEEHPVFSVGAVCVRGGSAQVDLVTPAAGGSSQLTSVYLERGIDGWWVIRDRRWTIPVADALDLSYPGKAIE